MAHELALPEQGHFARHGRGQVSVSGTSILLGVSLSLQVCHCALTAKCLRSLSPPSIGWLSATCLGQPAQAIVGTTSDTISLASVTLAPRKTSLWTSALSPSLLALGCDRKVLVSPDPSSPQMDAYVTGGKHGGGAVFALDLAEVSCGGS